MYTHVKIIGTKSGIVALRGRSLGSKVMRTNTKYNICTLGLFESIREILCKCNISHARLL